MESKYRSCLSSYTGKQDPGRLIEWQREHIDKRATTAGLTQRGTQLPTGSKLGRS